MKRAIIFLSSLGLGVWAQAQETQQTLLKTPDIRSIGVYIAPEIQYGLLKDEPTTFGGASLMVVLNQHVAIGGSMTHSLQRDFSPSGISPLYLHAGYGGLKMEYSLRPTKAIHLTFPLLIGGGFASKDSNYTSNRFAMDSMSRFNRSNSSEFLIIQPGVQIEANLIKYVKVYIGAGYRFAFSADKSNTLPASTMNGYLIYTGIKAGIFDYELPKRKR